MIRHSFEFALRLFSFGALLMTAACFNVNLKTFASSRLQLSERSGFWDENVKFFDLSSSASPAGENVRELPLFLLGGAFFPEGNTNLHIFEMKYRTMMFDVSQNDDMFGYIHSEGGQIASIGTLCKITRRQLLEDGRQFIELEGVGRFKVRKIVKTLPVTHSDTLLIYDS